MRLLPGSLALLLTIALAGPARAAAPDPSAVLLDAVDGDAAAILVVRVRPDGLAALAGWLGKLPAFADVLPAQEPLWATATTLLGFDPRTPEGWAPAGLAAAPQLAVSILSVDAVGAEKVFLAAAKAKKATLAARPFARVRLAVAVADAAKLDAFLGRVAASGALTAPGVSNEAVAGALGVAVGQAAAAKKALAKAKIRLVGRLGADFVFVRVEGGLVLVDHIIPFASGQAVDWAKEGKDVLQAALAKPRGKTAAILARPVTAGLLEADLGLRVEPGRLLDAARFLGWGNVLGAAAGDPGIDVAELFAAGADEVAAAESFRPLATSGPISEAIFTIRVTPATAEVFGVEAEARFALRPAYGLAATLLVASDGLADLPPADAILAGALFLSGTGPLRALPRPGVLAEGFDKTAGAATRCGGACGAVLAVFGWPVLLGMALDGVADSGDNERLVVENIRNLVVAVREVNMLGFRAVGAASFTSTPALDAILPGDAVRSFIVGGRAVELWAQGRGSEAAPFKVALPAGRIALGLAAGREEVLRWFFSRPQGASGAPPHLGLLRLDVGRALRAVPPPYSELADRLGVLQVLLTVASDRVALQTRIELK